MAAGGVRGTAGPAAGDLLSWAGGGRRRQEAAGDSSGWAGREGAAGAPPHLTRATTTDTHTGSGPCDTGDDNTGQ